MKKTLVALTMVLAAATAPLFAETGFSGSVKYRIGSDFDQVKVGTDNDSKIALDGTVGDFTSVSAAIEADDDSEAKAGIFTLTQDVTGALGMEGPFSFSFKLGKQTYEPQDYSKVAGYDDAGHDAKAGQSWAKDGDNHLTTNSMLGTVLKFKYETYGLDIAVFPGSYVSVDKLIGFDADAKAAFDAAGFDMIPEFGVNVYGKFADVLDVSGYLVLSAKTNATESDDDDTDTKGNYAGLNLGYTKDSLKVGAIWEMALAQDQVKYTKNLGTDTYTISKEKTDASSKIGVSAQYIIDKFTPGVAFGGSIYDGFDFAQSFGAGVNLTYAATDAVKVWAAFKTPFGVADSVDFSDAIGYEAGAEAVLDSVTYSAGYTFQSDFKAYDAEIKDGNERKGNAFFQVTAKF